MKMLIVLLAGSQLCAMSHGNTEEVLVVRDSVWKDKKPMQTEDEILINLQQKSAMLAGLRIHAPKEVEKFESKQEKALQKLQKKVEKKHRATLKFESETDEETTSKVDWNSKEKKRSSSRGCVLF